MLSPCAAQGVAYFSLFSGFLPTYPTWIIAVICYPQWHNQQLRALLPFAIHNYHFLPQTCRRAAIHKLPFAIHNYL
jgi:hypothetical protein